MTHTVPSPEMILQGYVRRGWALVPLHNVDDAGRCSCAAGNDPVHWGAAGKHPIHNKWQAQPVRDVRDWARLPDGRLANVGIATGAASGIWVLDIDPANGGMMPPGLPQTYTVRTGGGGWQLYFSLPPDFMPSNSRGRLKAVCGPGLDVRGDGGQVVAPPSRSAKGWYAVVVDVDPVPAPAWLLDLVRPAPVSEGNVSNPRGFSMDAAALAVPADAGEAGRAVRYAAAAVVAEIEKLANAVVGERNETAFSVAANLHELLSAPWAALDASRVWGLYLEAVEACDLPPAEGHDVWRSAARHTVGKARAFPALPEPGRVAPAMVPPFAEPSPHGAPAPAQNGAAPGRLVSSTTASAVKMRNATWLWADRMPAGAITLLAGREGIGKSTISYDIAGRLTRGELDGVYAGRPRVVGIIAAEDDREAVIAPRLAAANAVLGRVEFVDVAENGLDTIVTLPEDMAQLRHLVARTGMGLLIVDPLMSVLEGSIDTHVDREVRKALDPLARFASETGCAVLGLIHVNKSVGSDPMNAIMGSRAFGAVARSVLFCNRDGRTLDDDAYIFGHAKSSYGRRQPVVAYGIESVRVADGGSLTGGLMEVSSAIHSSRVVWGEVEALTLEELMEPAPKTRATGAVAIQLREYIAAQPTAISVGEISVKFPEVSADALKQNLSRMAKRGEIVRIASGLYTCQDQVTP